MKNLKNKTAYNAKLLKMDNDIYSLRRKVMDVIYEIKEKGYELPRIEVRIVSDDTEACAYAYLGKNIIHFNKSYMNRNNFKQIVLHEVVHAVFSVGEIKGCKLMHCSMFWKNNVNENDAWDLFNNYYNKWK